MEWKAVNSDGEPHSMQWGKYKDGGAVSDDPITGYTTDQILQIENAFEGYEGYEGVLLNKDEDGYLGLMRVVDCLIKIHEGTEEEAKEAKELFT